MGALLDGRDCKILLDSGASESFMSKDYYLSNKTLHGLPKFSSKVKLIQVGNGEIVNIFSIIFIITTTQSHMFEFTLWYLKYMKM